MRPNDLHQFQLKLVGLLTVTVTITLMRWQPICGTFSPTSSSSLNILKNNLSILIL
uniref:Uncharacterized protein n=1 Tax=Anguilla anguilla TaxID=7936 RepID=A0A0E9VTI3_ANGAN